MQSIRVLPCSRFAYVKIQSHQCVSQVARRQGHSRRGGCWVWYRRRGVRGQACPEPISAR